MMMLVTVEGGHAIARTDASGQVETLSFPFEDRLVAERFLAIARYDLGFVPSALPHVAERFRAPLVECP